MARAPFQVLVLPYRFDAEERPEYALFRRADLGVWQAIAGGGEGDETPEQAARREAAEEAGIAVDAALLPLESIARIPVHHFAASAIWGTEVMEIPEYSFGVSVDYREFRLSVEHTRVEWLPYEQARERFEWESNRNALDELNRLILSRRDR